MSRLTPEQQQELAELRRLDQLEAKFANRSQPEQKTGVIDAMGAGSAQAATLGYTPQIVGGLANFLGGKTKLATGEEIENVPYVEARDATDRSINKARQDQPLAYHGANLVGNVMAGGQIAKALPAAGTFMGSVKQGAAIGGGMGALSNPGETAGEISPLQLADRATNAAAGTAVGGLGGGLASLIGKGVNVGKDIRDVKSGKMSAIAKDEIDAAIGQVNQKQLAPLDTKLKGILEGKQISVNPDRLTTTPNLARSLAKRAIPDEMVAPQPGYPGVMSPRGPARADIDAPRALSLRRALDKEAGYGRSKPFDPTAVAKGETAKAEADIIRRKLAEIPGVNPIQEESARIMALRDALEEKSRSAPVSALQNQVGSDQYNIVKQIDDMAGSKLVGLGDRISGAQDLILDPKRLNPGNPGAMLKEVARIATRGGIGAAEKLDRVVPAGTKEAVGLSLQQALRKPSKKGKKK